jgi:hypothetical protein
MVTSGVRESYSANEIEFARVSFDVTPGEYYQPHRLSTILLSGFGQIPGEKMDPTQKKVTVGLESKVMDQLEFEIMTHDARLTQETTLTTGSLGTGSYGSTNTLTVTDASIFRPYDIITNMTTGEQLLITAVDTSASPDEITVYPAFEQTAFSGLTTFPWTLTNGTPQAKTNGDTVRIIGNAFPERSRDGNLIDSDPTTAVNYMQIFRETFGLGFEQQLVKKNGRAEMSDVEERALGDLLVKMEKAIVEGSINKQSVTDNSETKTVRSMQGIEGTISTYNQAASALEGGGNDITVAKLDELVDQLAPANKSGKIVGLCSGNFIRKFRELMDNKVEVQVPVGSDTFGLKALVYEGQIPIYLVQHEIYNSTGKTDEALFFDPGHYKLVNLRGGELGLASEKKGLAGGTADNEEMSMKDAHFGIYSLEYKFEQAASIVTGLSHTISS